MMDQQEAFEILSGIVGHPLALNGVHGEDLKSIAKHIVDLRQERKETSESVASMIARSMDPQPGQVMVIYSKGYMSPQTARALTNELSIPILLISEDDALDSVTLHEAKDLVERMLELFPQLLSSKNVEVAMPTR